MPTLDLSGNEISTLTAQGFYILFRRCLLQYLIIFGMLPIFASWVTLREAAARLRPSTQPTIYPLLL